MFFNFKTPKFNTYKLLFNTYNSRTSKFNIYLSSEVQEYDFGGNTMRFQIITTFEICTIFNKAAPVYSCYPAGTRRCQWRE